MIVNKYLRQNWKIFNKISFRPIEIDVPEEYEKNPDEWCEKIWIHITEEPIVRLNHWARRKNYTITLLTDTDYLYLVQCLRTEWNTDETSIYMVKYTEDNYNDFKAIAKFVHKNIEDIIGHHKKGFESLNKLVTAQEIQKEMNTPDGKA